MGLGWGQLRSERFGTDWGPQEAFAVRRFQKAETSTVGSWKLEVGFSQLCSLVQKKTPGPEYGKGLLYPGTLYVDTFCLQAHFMAWSPGNLPLACHQWTPIQRTA
jgi:hypothetical protein